MNTSQQLTTIDLEDVTGGNHCRPSGAGCAPGPSTVRQSWTGNPFCGTTQPGLFSRGWFRQLASGWQRPAANPSAGCRRR